MTSSTPPTKANRDGLHKRPLIALISGAMVVGALISGCGGSSSTGSALQPQVTQTRSQFVDYAACMRSHGVAGYPDPQVSATASGVSVTISPGSANPNSPGFRSADRGCRHLLPDGVLQVGPGGSSAVQQAQDVVFADCMRSDGVSGFPDPDHDGVFTLPATINEQAPAFLGAMHSCQKAQPSSLSIDQAP